MADHEDLWLAMGEALEQPAETGAEPKLHGDHEFMLWMHSPITAAFFAFLGDQERNYLRALTELFLAGRISEDSTREDQNPLVWRGRILSLRDLQRISLSEIASFYRDKRGGEVSV